MITLEGPNSGSGGHPQVEITSEHFRRLVASCEQTGREHQQGKRVKEYSYHGRTCQTMEKGSTVNASHAMEDIFEYVESLPQKIAGPFGPDDEIPFATVGDCVCTLRNATSDAQASFLWPSTAISFQHAVTTSLATLPPGCCLVISNGLAIPSDLTKQRT